MAEHYLEFSEVITGLTPEERDWLTAQLEIVDVYGDEEFPEGDAPEHLAHGQPDWFGCRAYRDLEDFEPRLCEDAGFEYEFKDDALWMYTVEAAELDLLAHLVQKFLQHFRPDQCWSLTYAAHCSKPRVGEFAGGAVFITADQVTWHNAYDLVEKERKRFAAGQLSDDNDAKADKPGKHADVILNIHGGIVQDIFCSDPQAQVYVVDWDTDGCDPVDSGFLEVPAGQGRKQVAFVGQREVQPLTELAGSDVAAALKQAEVHHGPP